MIALLIMIAIALSCLVIYGVIKVTKNNHSNYYKKRRKTYHKDLKGNVYEYDWDLLTLILIFDALTNNEGHILCEDMSLEELSEISSEEAYDILPSHYVDSDPIERAFELNPELLHSRPFYENCKSPEKFYQETNDYREDDSFYETNNTPIDSYSSSDSSSGGDSDGGDW